MIRVRFVFIYQNDPSKTTRIEQFSKMHCTHEISEIVESSESYAGKNNPLVSNEDALCFLSDIQ